MTVMLSEVLAPRVCKGAQANVPRTWDFDWRAIERACERLELDDPVRLATTRGRTRMGGHFYYRADTITGREHELRVDAHVSAQDASRTLWHELAHARQAERYDEPAAWWAEYTRANKRGYDRNVYEIDARKLERLAARYPLVVSS